MCRRLSLLDPVTTPAGSVYERTFGATLSGVRSIECAEVLALDVYLRANGRPLTVRMVRDRLEQTPSTASPGRPRSKVLANLGF